jgi:hypothetical protein
MIVARLKLFRFLCRLLCQFVKFSSLSPLKIIARSRPVWFVSHTDLLPTRHLGWASIRQCALISTKAYTDHPDEQAKWTEREKKIHTVRPAGMKTRRSFSYTITMKKILFLTVLLLFAKCKINYCWLVTWLDSSPPPFVSVLDLKTASICFYHPPRSK